MLSLFNLSSRTTLLIAITGTTLLADCTLVKASPWLWRSNVSQTANSPSFEAITDATGNIYQGFSEGTQLFVRKVNPAGVESWRTTISNNVQAFADINLTRIDGSVVLTPNNSNVVVQLDENGNIVSTQTIAPTGSQITSLTPGSNGSLFVTFKSNSSTGVIALNAQLNQTWSHTVNADGVNFFFHNTSVAPLASGQVLLAIEANSNSFIYAFDSQGNLLQQNTLPRTTLALLKSDTAAFLVDYDKVSKLDDIGNSVWTHDFTEPVNCAANANDEVACVERPVLNGAIYNSPVTWLDTNGTERKKTDITSNGAETLYFNGHDKWVVKEHFEDASLNPGQIVTKEYHYDRYTVLSNDGVIVKRVTMTPSDWTFDCGLCNPQTGHYSTDGDITSLPTFSNDRLYVIGNTAGTKRGFISAYSL